MLATVNRSFGRGHRPRGRRVASGGSRWTQTTSVGGMGSKGRDGVGTLLCRSWFGLRKRGELAGADAAASGKQRERKKSRRRRLGLIARPGARGIDTQRAPCASAKPRAVADTPGRPEKGRRRWGGGRLLFREITELSLSSFCKLLPNFLKKLKISKNESCSTFQTLQLCFKEHFQILPPF